jgi:hypothetical protein
MLVTKRNQSIAGAIVAAVLGSTGLMNFPFISAHSSSMAPGARTARGSVQSQADGSAPLSVTPTLDTSRQVSATMSEAGGTLSVTAANGTAFTLTIPTDALVGEEEITMTPVAAIPDLPFSKGLGAGGGAVQLGPEGLLLVKSATLIIQPTSPISIDQQCPFAWYKAGEDFQLFPLTLDLTTVTMDVDHFNGYGIAVGSTTDRDAVAAHAPSRSEARFTQQLELGTYAVRQTLSQSPTKKQAKKATKKYNSQISQEFDSAFSDLDKQLGKDLESGGSVAPQSRPQDVAPAPAAVRCDLLNILVYLINLRNHGLTLADLGNLADPGLAAHIRTALDDLVLDSVARCQEGNLGEIGTLLGLGKFALILAALDPSLGGLSKVARNIYDSALNCAHLTLTFDSTIKSLFSPLAAGVEIELEATDVPLTPVLSSIGNGLPIYTGSAPLVHHIDTVDAGGAVHCSVSNNSTDSTLKIISLEFNIHLRFVECPGADATPPTDLDLLIDVGQPLENFTITCPEAGSYSTRGNTDIWRAQFYCEHNVGTSNHSATMFRFRGWDTVSTGNIATRLFDNVVPPACPAYKEFTVIKVNQGK